MDDKQRVSARTAQRELDEVLDKLKDLSRRGYADDPDLRELMLLSADLQSDINAGERLVLDSSLDIISDSSFSTLIGCFSFFTSGLVFSFGFSLINSFSGLGDSLSGLDSVFLELSVFVKKCLRVFVEIKRPRRAVCFCLTPLLFLSNLLRRLSFLK